MRFYLVLTVLLCSASSALSAEANPNIAGRASVVDGDTSNSRAREFASTGLTRPNPLSCVGTLRARTIDVAQLPLGFWRSFLPPLGRQSASLWSETDIAGLLAIVTVPMARASRAPGIERMGLGLAALQQRQICR